MSPAKAAMIIYSVVALFLTCAVLLSFYRRFRAEVLQERLAELRDRLFDVAAAARILGHPAYVHAAEQLELSMRHAQRFTLFRLALVILFRRRLEAHIHSGHPYSSPESVRADWLAIQTGVSRAIADYMLPGLAVLHTFGKQCTVERRLLSPQRLGRLTGTFRSMRNSGRLLSGSGQSEF